ncbi:MAG: folate-binding protein YgfZ [Mesorhizobium amorphae]|nr:MAG: folate-binding protein YgfZ [Mesorhizobium amorphae]
MPTISLPDRSTLSVSGPDAGSFLQNIVTTDVEALAPDELRACALLSPQGKILFDFLVSRTPEGFRLDLRADVAPDLAKRLTLYKLRAKVVIAAPEDAGISVSWDDPATPGVRDTRFPTEWNVERSYGTPAAPPSADDWNALRIRAGVAESGSDFELGDAFPHDVLLDQNTGVGFRKGCFVGQEVVSRMQHRGTARRRIVLVSASAPLPAPGTPVEASGRAIGTLGTVVGTHALALLRLDRVSDAAAAGQPITAGGAPLTVALPPGVSFTFPAIEREAAPD